ncbi:LysR family transcriptional regulator [Streptacidiphilus neutrinimicus]|uniref:LysR substrate-binding domain-containing protein n=1 Tax=Streptacidiphilus neutrinimicus TaxID=105420 RepID=UPI000693EC11|nr:LysR family transcriptional regulator [Streptacidiphilus neutrinimicus]
MTDLDHFDVRQLRAFLVVAEELSFTQAARRLFLTQQAVSSQVRSLETVLRVQLFERTTRKVRLTPAGRLLRDQVDPALRALDRALGCFQEARSIRIGHTPSAAHRLLPRTAGALERMNSRLNLQASECSEESLRAALLAGQLDVGVALEAGPAGHGLAVKLLGNEPWCAVVGTAHPLADHSRVSLTDLIPYEWLSWPRPSYPGYWNAIQRLTSPSSRRPVIRETWISLAYHHIVDGRSVTLQPASYAVCPPPKTVVIPLAGSSTATYSALWNPHHTPPGLDLLLEVLTESANHQ